MVKLKLFLSGRVVLEDSELDGGVLVDESGRIKRILDRTETNQLKRENDGSIEIIDGGKLALLAGAVDSHVHINEPGRTHWEGFLTATGAAAAGGITTVVDMPLNSIPPTTTMANLKQKALAAKGNVYVDVGFWGGVIPGNHESLQDLVKAGVVGFKCFLCPSGVDEFPNVEKEDLVKAFAALEGTGSLLAFHAEMEDDNSVMTTMKNKDPEEYSTYLETRPPEMELNAISFINSLLPTTKVRIHIVHVSSSQVVPLLESARSKRLEAGNTDWCAGITAETCHHYLTLNSEDVPRGHSEYKCAPPVRDPQNREKLWQCLREEKINLVVSDHSPCTSELKCANNLEAWGGISSVQFGMSLFWSAACIRGIGLCEMSKYLSRGPAKLCSPLRNRKGSLKPGYDADLVFFDPEATFEVTPEIIRYKNKLTPYIGRELKGKVVKTYLRGQLIYSNDDLIGSPKGKLLLNYY